MEMKEKPEEPYLKEALEPRQTVLPTAPNRAAGRGEEQAWEGNPGATSEQQAVQHAGCSPVLEAWGADPPLRSLTPSDHCRQRLQLPKSIH